MKFCILQTRIGTQSSRYILTFTIVYFILEYDALEILEVLR
jgi:hypothetical protein